MIDLARKALRQSLTAAGLDDTNDVRVTFNDQRAPPGRFNGHGVFAKAELVDASGKQRPLIIAGDALGERGG